MKFLKYSLIILLLFCVPVLSSGGAWETAWEMLQAYNEGGFFLQDVKIYNATEDSGGITLKTVTASSGTLTGATDTIDVAIPAGCLLIGVQLRVDVAITDSAGDDTWSAEWNDSASLQAIVAGAAAAKNTKVNAWHNDNANTPITDAETNIVLTPNGGNFSTGEITAVGYYYQFTALDDAP